jgi:hypothetical protein
MLFLVPVFAAAETASEITYATYQNQTNGYSIDYPEAWTVLSKENLQPIMDSITSGETQIAGMDGSVLESYKAQIESMDMVMFVSEDGAFNTNIAYQAVPMKYSSDDIVNTMYPAVLQQFQSMFSDYTPLSDPQVETVGDIEYVEIAGQYTLSGVTYVMLQAYYSTDSVLYSVTFTINSAANPDMNSFEAICNGMLGSFVPASKA